MAYISLVSEEPDVGLKYAEKAYKLSPNNLNVVDTMAWLLIKNDEVEKGYGLLQEISTKTNNPSVQFHYANALVKVDKKAQAKQTLQKILSTKIQFDERKDAEQMLSSLK
jgi:predicted Zn-dependent protease